ncbi:MAG: DUF2141 domain-containing protein [Pseudomonadota bacterium]
MKKAALSAAALFVVCAGAALADDIPATDPFDHVSCRGADNEVRVKVVDVEDNIGLIVADLYRNDEEGFLKRSGRVAQVRFAARAPHTTFCMAAPESGDFAIALYHDQNANKTLDKKAFGLPAEPWGISNAPRILFGPPKVDEALFQVPETGATVEIKLNN